MASAVLPGIGRGVAAVSVLLGLASCSEEPAPPGEGSSAGPSDLRVRLAIPAPPAQPAPSASGPAEAPLPVRAPSEGPACDQGFHVSGEPRRDVVRLGLLCGPAEGYDREKDAIEGVVAEGGTSVEVGLSLTPGRCYRVVAAAEASLSSLEVQLRSERDIALATSEPRGSFVVLQRGTPICTGASGEARIVFRAQRGRGRFAAEVWSKPAAGPLPSPDEPAASEAGD